MMRIGLDIDNVISDFDKGLLEAFINEDKNKRNTGIINENAHITKGMFDWTNEEIKVFFLTKMEELAKCLTLRDDAKYYMDKMLKDGHELYLITHRSNTEYSDPYNLTCEWLEKNDIHYTKLILSKTPDKSDECKENKVDIMIDDRVSQCKRMIANGINCLAMATRYNGDDLQDIDHVNTWKELYEYIKKLEKRNRR